MMNSMPRLLQFDCMRITVFGALLGVIVGTAGARAAQPTTSSQVDDLTGIWWIEHYDKRLLPDQGEVPLTDLGKALYEKNAAGLRDGSLLDRAISDCLPMGLPRAMNSAYPIQIIQKTNLVTLIHEENHTPWFVAIQEKHSSPRDIDAAFMGGESIGRWEGRTLIVDSVGFKAASFLDDTGLPHGTKLHVVQRLRRLGDGKRLEDIIRIEDPDVFSQPWTVRRTYESRPDVTLMEFVCGEPNRALYGERVAGMHVGQQAP